MGPNQSSSTSGSAWSRFVRVDTRAVKDLVFIGGHTPRAPDGSVVGEGDFAAQFAQVYANLTTTIENAGIEWTDVVSLRTYLARPDDVLSFRVLRDAEHARLFPDGGPQSTPC